MITIELLMNGCTTTQSRMQNYDNLEFTNNKLNTIKMINYYGNINNIYICMYIQFQENNDERQC